MCEPMKECRRTQKCCYMNIGFYRTGSTTLSKAFQSLSMKVYQDAISDQNYLKQSLINYECTVQTWWTHGNGLSRVLRLAQRYDHLYDGWFPLLAFLSNTQLLELRSKALDMGVSLTFLATIRNIEAYVQSELHHWVRHDLEKRSNLSTDEREKLELFLRNRFEVHSNRLISFAKYLIKENLDGTFHILPLQLSSSYWPSTLSSFTGSSRNQWEIALKNVGRCNANPKPPVEGILLTFRMKNNHNILENIDKLLSSIEQDKLCRYLLVIAFDDDEYGSPMAENFIRSLIKRKRMLSLEIIRNKARTNEVLPLCHIWSTMAERAWSRGADWTIFLGDDVTLKCPYHYRAIYRAFLDVSKRIGCPFGFGCPWLNDETFEGFPTFPVVSKVHQNIFGGLIPYHRKSQFVNQDLDPYLQRMYSKFSASPYLEDVKVANEIGGHNCKKARYERTPVPSWREWVLYDVAPLKDFLNLHGCDKSESVLVDVVIPTYRLKIDYLQKLTSLEVPASFSTTFIVIVDNPDRLMYLFPPNIAQREEDPQMLVDLSSKQLEAYLRKFSKAKAHNVRVRCNVQNMGASASRNRGLDESSAEFILFLDDDVIPNPKILQAYAEKLSKCSNFNGSNRLMGMIGTVRFPRRRNMPLKHAAVLSSQLHSMFEIATIGSHPNPAWGVTANLMVRRIPKLRFDEHFIKTGGGEDVDFCLRLQKNGGLLYSVEDANVDHEFWEGSIITLAKRFYRWATSDAKLFSRFSNYVYRSWPNAVEFVLFVNILHFISFSLQLKRLCYLTLGVLFVDTFVDIFDRGLYKERFASLNYAHSLPFVVMSQLIGNFYILSLETGRLLSHLRNLNLQYLCSRFDWHCNRYPGIVHKLRMRELKKFIGFVFIAVFVMSMH